MAETFALGVVFKAPLFLEYRHLDGIAEATPPRQRDDHANLGFA